jgi:hypothetical protein
MAHGEWEAYPKRAQRQMRIWFWELLDLRFDFDVDVDICC